MIQSLDRAFQILELLNTLECAKKGLGGLEISKTLGLKHPTVHNFLKSLTELGYIYQDPDTKKFKLAEKAKMLGMNMLQCESLAAYVKPYLHDLVKITGETAILVIMDNDQRHTVLVENGHKPYRVEVNSAMDQHFYDTSTGRVMVANMTEAERVEFMQRVPMESGNALIPGSYQELIKIISNIRTKGYDWGINGEVTAIGVPLVNKSKGVNAAIGSYFYTNDQTAEEIQEIAEQMQLTAGQILQKY